MHPSVVPPHYFTLDPSQKRLHDPNCNINREQPDVTQTPLISMAVVDNEENLGKEEYSLGSSAIGDPRRLASSEHLKNDSGTCSWP